MKTQIHYWEEDREPPWPLQEEKGGAERREHTLAQGWEMKAQEGMLTGCLMALQLWF